MIFVNSMSDLFHEDVPTEYIAAIGRVMVEANWHTYQVLTKRHERMRRLLSGELAWVGYLPHVWFGVSVENRRHGVPRINALRDTPVAVRFLSIEPLLEDLGPIDLSGITWVIAGGESGVHARPMRDAWVRNIRDQCAAQSVPFFLKQLGGRRGKRGGDDAQLDGRLWREIPVDAVAHS
jgi:protein gp37